MGWFPEADRSVVGVSSGAYKGGPFHLIIHTTEGGSAEGAFSAYRSKGVWPHATADEYCVYQHIDSSVAASAVLNESGGVETNRLSSIQIELVGYHDQPKSHAMLRNAAAFCAWACETHGIPYEWPNGRPMGPGGPYNRSTSNWTSRPGWYAHSQVPENTHIDPGFLSDEELSILMGEPMQPISIIINNVDQTAAVKAFLADANSLVDLSDLCAYSRYAPPTYDNATDTVSFSTAKTTCQLYLPNGSVCGQSTAGLLPVPVGRGGLTTLQSICQAHRDELDRQDRAVEPDEVPPEQPGLGSSVTQALWCIEQAQALLPLVGVTPVQEALEQARKLLEGEGEP